MQPFHAVSRLRWLSLAGFFAVLALFVLSMSGGALAQAQSEVPPQGPVAGQVPGNALGGASDSDMWRAVREGVRGRVTIPDKQAGQLVQSEGDNWRAARNGPVSTYGVWLMLGMIGLLALFFLLRGRIRIESGRAGITITRFNLIERTGHWLLAVSFIVLALTGLNILYGRYFLLPVVGPEIFGTLTLWGKYLHNYIAFAFMVGLVLVFVMWVANNLPSRNDLVWLAKGGGMFSRGTHVHARKFNAGQKVIFWLVILGGVSISLSGLSLMFPYELPMFAKTFAFLNVFGLDLPTDLTLLQEMQLSQLWHAIMGLLLVALIIAHIYLGTIGMEGAFDAMRDGEVDINWAREHHDLWVEEVREREARRGGEGAPAPAE